MRDRHHYRETTRKSWGTNIKNSISGIFVGFLLVIGMIALLWWNEGRAVKTAKGLAEGLAEVIQVDAAAVDPSNDNKLVHLSGDLVADSPIEDAEFGIVADAIKLKRNVEFYQWVEKSNSKTDKKLGGASETTTDYYYTKEWTDKEVNSSSFKLKEGHYNEINYAYDGYELSANIVRMGDYIVSRSVLGGLTTFQSLDMSNYDKTEIPNGQIVIENYNNKGTIEKLYIGYGSNNSPQIGDVKISFEYIAYGEFSIVAAQDGNTLVPHKTSQGTVISLIEIGERSAETMFETAQTGNSILTWMLRGIGFVMMFMGFKMISSIIVAIGNVIPFLGTIFDYGLGLAAGVLTFVISFTTIALAWIYYRPILGVSILVIVAGVTLFIYKRSLDKKGV